MKIIIAIGVAFVLSFLIGWDWTGFVIATILILAANATPKQKQKKGKSQADLQDAALAVLPTIARIKFDYFDAEDAHTKRTVSIKKHDSNRKTGLIKGFCHQRQAMRSFRFDRIKNAIDADTGEIVDDLQAYLNSIKKAQKLKDLA